MFAFYKISSIFIIFFHVFDILSACVLFLQCLLSAMSLMYLLLWEGCTKHGRRFCILLSSFTRLFLFHMWFSYSSSYYRQGTNWVLEMMSNYSSLILADRWDELIDSFPIWFVKYLLKFPCQKFDSFFCLLLWIWMPAWTFITPRNTCILWLDYCLCTWIFYFPKLYFWNFICLWLHDFE